MGNVSRTALRRAMAQPTVSRTWTQTAAKASAARTYATASKSLKDTFADGLPEKIEQIKTLRKGYGDKVLGEVTLDQVYGGARGIKSLVWEGSVLDSEEGIRFRGKTIPECQELLPKAPGGQEPLPEGLFWLLVTGDIPTEEQVRGLSKDWASRAELPSHVVAMLNNFPSNLHPMAQFSAAMAALHSESKFSKAYADGVHKSKYWDTTFEDSMDLIAKLPVVAATIYNNLYRDGAAPCPIDVDKDWSYNFTEMIGHQDPMFTELMRLYLTIHSDHEGGNVSAHATHLVGSALSDPYLSYCAGMCGLAGPLHGLANQESLRFVERIQRLLGDKKPTKEFIHKFVIDLLESGQVVPGFGHAVLRVTDPRYMIQREFALKHLGEDSDLFKIVDLLFQTAPEILKDWKGGKIANPWPNVDSHSGVLLHEYGIKEDTFYTVLFGMSRAIGVLSNYVIDRALFSPIERPKSVTLEWVNQNYCNP